jgi:hypothetical protein
MSHPTRVPLLALLIILIAALHGACGNSNPPSAFITPGPEAGPSVEAGSGDDVTVSDDGPIGFGDDAAGDDASGALAIAPANQAIDVDFGKQTPTVQYTATASGHPVAASFSIDRGEIGSIDASTGVMTPTGNVGGVANVTATYQGQTATTQLTVRVHLVDNGSAGMGDAGADGGAGGNGGVGGEGPGGPVDMGTQGVLNGQPMADSGLGWLYPYDKTVWPRGLLAPLLQWTAPRSYDALSIHIQEAAFEYKGYFAKTATPFVHHPIPQTAWQALAYSNGGEDVTVTLVFAAGGQAYGPLTETWKIAHGTLSGTVYYNSYGTNLAHNYTGGGVTFGGATLAIKHGATSPTLVAGNDNECRVCHSVSADGSRLVTQQGNNYSISSSYALTSGYAETPMAATDGRFGWPAMYPDGTFLLSNGAKLAGGGWNGDAQLFAVPAGTSIASTGIPAGLRMGTPVFSPDGKHIAFNYYGGASADHVSLATMDFDPATKTFSNLQVVFTPPAGTTTSGAIWPSFMPTSDAIVFELEVQYNGRDWGGTRSSCDSTACVADSASGAQGELWWVDLTSKTASRLDALNGKGYLPTNAPTQHTNDAVLHYEPTVSPVPSGGYAWVVFTSRRLYGNVATLPPYESDPRYTDLSKTATTKKLWVAAVDLNAKSGDPSHPAFYLPAQELLAGNSRGYWVVDPCQPNGQSCQTGDECCGGYCKDVDGGFVCTDQPPPCSMLNDKCVADTDCCGGAMSGIKCINGRCAQPGPPQ